MKFATMNGGPVRVDVVVVGWDGQLVADDKPGNWRIMAGEFLFDDNHARAFSAGVLAACDELDARAKGP